jgi:hypothetical protein
LSDSAELVDKDRNKVVINPSEAVGLLLREVGDAGVQDTYNGNDGMAYSYGSTPADSTARTPNLLFQDPVPQQVLELWNQHRFVRQGWFTEREAIGYVQT